MPGNSEIAQLNLIIDLLGTPTVALWPELATLPGIAGVELRKQPFNNVKNKFPWLSPSGIALLNDMFRYDPRRRSSAQECLDSSYFKDNPLRKSILDLLIFNDPKVISLSHISAKCSIVLHLSLLFACLSGRSLSSLDDGNISDAACEGKDKVGGGGRSRTQRNAQKFSRKTSAAAS